MAACFVKKVHTCRETHGSHVDLALPYELRALEAALISGTRIMESVTTELENQALPSLKRLIERVSLQQMARHTYIWLREGTASWSQASSQRPHAAAESNRWLHIDMGPISAC